MVWARQNGPSRPTAAEGRDVTARVRHAPRKVLALQVQQILDVGHHPSTSLTCSVNSKPLAEVSAERIPHEELGRLVKLAQDKVETNAGHLVGATTATC
jgi:hypothetical protein